MKSRKGDVRKGDVRKGDVRKGDVRKGDVRKGDVRKGDGNGKRKTRRNRNTRKIKKNTKIQKKYGAGDFRRRAEFTAAEAMRPLTIDDFTKERIMHKQRLISDVLVLEDPVYDTETQTDTLSIKLPTINLLTYEYFRDQLLKKLSLTLIAESNDSRQGQFNGVYIVKGDFDSDKKYALRISKNKFKFKPIYGEKPEGETFIEDYLEELKLFAKLSQGEITPNQGEITPNQGEITPNQGGITPNVYYGGLFLTKGQQREQGYNNYYHFYSITEAFDNELFAFIETVYENNYPNVSKLLEYLIGENGKVINLIDKFSKYGINCDCRSTNIVANKGITHLRMIDLRMIDIDTKYYIEFDDLMELFEDDDYSYLHVFPDKDSDEDREKIVMAISGDVMKYIFMLELISSGIENNYLKTKIKEILTPRNKCIFLFLFLKSFKFVRGIVQVVGPLLTRFGIDPPIVNLLFVDYIFIKNRFKKGLYEYNNEEIYKTIESSSPEKRKLIQEYSSPEKRTKISRSSSA